MITHYYQAKFNSSSFVCSASFILGFISLVILSYIFTLILLYGESLFEIEKPLTAIGVGVDEIPEDIRNSEILSGNNLGQLGNIEAIPDETEVNEYKLLELSDIYLKNEKSTESLKKALHQHAKDLLNQGNVNDAWKTLLSFNN